MAWPSRSLQRGRRCSRRRGIERAARAAAEVSLQRGRRCSRRRGIRRRGTETHTMRLQRGRRCSRRRGQHVFSKKRHPVCFNEAGVVHAGEAAQAPFPGLKFGASTRPALFTPERKSAAPAPKAPPPLQRGRRCSRRRGSAASARTRAQTSRFNEAGVVHAGEELHGIACFSVVFGFNEAGVVHAGEGRHVVFCLDLPHPLQRGRRCSRRRGSGHRWLRVTLRPASTRPALFTPER